MGVLECLNKVDAPAFTEEDMQNLKSFSSIASATLELAKMRTESSKLMHQRTVMLRLAELMQLPELGIDTSGAKSREALEAVAHSICNLAADLVNGSKACVYLLNEDDELHKVASTFSPLLQVHFTLKSTSCTPITCVTQCHRLHPLSLVKETSTQEHRH